MKKKLSSVILLILLLTLLIFWSIPSARDAIGTEVINDFMKGNYEYTITYYTIKADGTEQLGDSYEGQLISEPYQQYEWLKNPSSDTFLQEIYCYEKDWNIYSDMKVCTYSQDEDFKWMRDRPSEKKPNYYIIEGLAYTYDRNEEVEGVKTSVFTSEYEIPSVAASQAERIELPSSMKPAFYVDMKKRAVVRVVVDMHLAADKTSPARDGALPAGYKSIK